MARLLHRSIHLNLSDGFTNIVLNNESLATLSQGVAGQHTRSYTSTPGFDYSLAYGPILVQ